MTVNTVQDKSGRDISQMMDSEEILLDENLQKFIDSIVGRISSIPYGVGDEDKAS